MPNIHSNISFALVNIPVIMNPVIHNNDTSFNQLHDKCLNRIKYIKYCPYCKKDVKEANIIKGYEYEKNNYLVFKKEELNKLKPENDQVIDVVSFINISEIDPSYFEKSYMLASDSKSKAYLLFYEALKKTKKVALAKTVLGNKFYYCILRFTKYGIVLTTLYFEEELELEKEDIKAEYSEKELNLAIKLIDSLTTKFEPSKYKDEYQENIKKAINDKLEGKTIRGKKRKPREKIDNLMEALEKSLKVKK